MAKGKAKKHGKKARKSSSSRKVNHRRAKELISLSDQSGDLESQLRTLQLVTKDMTGDGNCLFRALSDQYYGDDSKHRSIRKEVCEYLWKHEEEYKFFVEDDQSFEHHVTCMEDDGTYGGNMELVSFAKLKDVDIKVYQPGMIYCIAAQEDEEDEDIKESNEKQTLHIAYHSWEHYSSIRNADGPFTGPPEIKEINLEERALTMENNGDESDPSSVEKVVLNACPETSLAEVRQLLKKYKGDPDIVINVLYESAEDSPSENVANAVVDEENPMAQPADNSPTKADSDHEELNTILSHSGEDTKEKEKDQKENKENEVESQSDEEEIPKVEAKHAEKLSPKERRMQAKMLRKENQRLKKQKAQKSSATTDEDGVTRAMKQLYI